MPRWRSAICLLAVGALFMLSQCSKAPAPISEWPKEQAPNQQRPPIAAAAPSEAFTIQGLSAEITAAVAAPMDPTAVQFDDPHAPCNDTPGAFENQKDKRKRVNK